MPDYKTILLIVALGGTNALQYLGITQPTTTAKSEVQANAEFMRDELHVCINALKDCNE